MSACALPPIAERQRRRPPPVVDRLARAALCAVVIGAAVAPSAGHVAAQGSKIAVLQGLDKVTARISTIHAPIDRKVRFGTLEITARTCHKRSPVEPPETTAFLEIRDLKPGELPTRLFIGWMFASSPALHALEHPVYDVWVIDCKTLAPGQP